MSAQVFIGGSWRNITGGKIFLGGSWRNITRGKIYKGGAWLDGPAFTSTLAVVDMPSIVNVSGSSASPITLDSGVITATPSGGVPPYSYAWSIINDLGPAMTLSSTATASTSAHAVLSAGDFAQSALRVTVTDSIGSTATADATVTLSNDF